LVWREWFAFQSNEAGSNEVDVHTYPVESAGLRRITTDREPIHPE